MAHRGGDEYLKSLKWSNWEWIPEQNKFRRTAKDHKGKVYQEWGRAKPRSVPKSEPLAQQPNENQEEAESTAYSFRTPAVVHSSSETEKHLGPSKTPTPLRPFPPQSQPALSGYSEHGQPGQFQYQSFQEQPSQNYNTASEWRATEGNSQRGTSQMGGAAGSQYQGQYNGTNQWATNYEPASRGPYATAPLMNYNSSRVPHGQSRGATGATWDSSQYNPDPRQQGALQGQNMAPDYQIQHAAQNTPSGSSYNMAPATRYLYPMQNSSLAQPNRLNYSPEAMRNRPHSMHVSHGSEEYDSLGDDSINKMTEDMGQATLTTNSSKGSSAVYEGVKRSKSRLPESEVALELDSSASELKREESDLEDDDISDKFRREKNDTLSISGSSRLYSSNNRPSYPARGSGRPSSYDQDNVDVTQEKGTSRTYLPSGNPTSRHRRQSDASVIDERISGTGFEKSVTHNQGSSADARRDKPKSTPSNRSNSEGTLMVPTILRSGERSNPQSTPSRRRDSNRNNSQPFIQNQRGTQAPECQGFRASLQLAPQSQTTIPERVIRTRDPNRLDEPLHPEFFKQHSSFFRKGRVFKCLWSEPLGLTPSQLASDAPTEEEMTTAPADFLERAYHSIRRFVVVRERDGFSLCVPILTYGGQGTNKSGVNPGSHAVIYIGPQPPQPPPGEAIHKRHVRVEPFNGREKLAPKSRVNYSKVYTVEHNVKVCFIGKIHAESYATFFTDFEGTLDR